MNINVDLKEWCKEKFFSFDLLAEEALYDLEKKIEKSSSFDEIKDLMEQHKELSRVCKTLRTITLRMLNV